MARNDFPIDRTEVEDFVRELDRVAALHRKLPPAMVKRLASVWGADFEGSIAVRFKDDRRDVLVVELAGDARDLLADLRGIV